ncbi:aspartyl protease family protein [Polaribacter sp. Hel1_85]|uniref:aspartyl protease family protein n=1 Tax=Polaribacter sp. Hel1_85 TaxID=1250005 RepID=UPI00052C0F5C|nr:aspartyl protease family protein [Polaribacter sp. Hel1_85]KGL59042.1 hypothetical protein PHEL85_3316 [Polaribacter sp. Hel1_85]
MKVILSLLFALSLISCLNKKETQILKTNSKTISIKDGDGFHKDIWEISPETELDEFITRKFVGKKEVSFISDIDTLIFNVSPNNSYDFIIEFNGKEKAFTRINTDTLKQPSIPPKKILDYYYKDINRIANKDTIPFMLGKDNRIYIAGKINNSNPLNFLFDTGADAIVITSSVIGSKVNLELDGETENIGSDGSKLIRTSSNNILEIAHLNWDNIELVSIDYKNRPFDGIIGWIPFENKIVEIDYEKKNLIIHKSINTIPKGYSKVETKMIDNLPYIKGTITIGEKSFSGWFEYDSGYNASFSLSQKFASENELNNLMQITGTSYSSGSSGTKLKANDYVLPKLTLGEFEIFNIPLSIDEKDPINIGNNDILGNNVLKRFNTILDFKNFEIYLKPNDLLNSKY